eukprot:COSAG05_NODE_1563_length_4553_cov_12.689044_1_plen_159_part_00
MPASSEASIFVKQSLAQQEVIRAEQQYRHNLAAAALAELDQQHCGQVRAAAARVVVLPACIAQPRAHGPDPKESCLETRSSSEEEEFVALPSLCRPAALKIASCRRELSSETVWMTGHRKALPSRDGSESLRNKGYRVLGEIIPPPAAGSGPMLEVEE